MSAPVEKPAPSSLRLVGTLALAGALAGFCLVFVFRATQPRIQAYKAEMLRLAIQEVLQEPDRYETLYVHQGRLFSEPPEGVKADDLERVYLGYREGGGRVGFAIAAAEPGFQDVVRVIFGYDPATRRILGMKVLESKETPGLGDKIEKDGAFVGQFAGSEAPLHGVRTGAGSGAKREIDMITGATISSRAVIRIINNALERLDPALQASAEAAR